MGEWVDDRVGVHSHDGMVLLTRNLAALIEDGTSVDDVVDETATTCSGPENGVFGYQEEARALDVGVGWIGR